MDLVPSEGAVRAARVVEAMIAKGLPLADLAVFADAFQRAGLEVRFPVPGEPGAVVFTRRTRCGKPTCRCREPDEPGHGPYVYKRVPQATGRAQVVYVGPVKGPRSAPRRLRQVEAVEPQPGSLDPKFLIE